MNNIPQKSYSLLASHLLLALAIVAVWGTNFVVIKLSLESFPPFVFSALRYIFAFLPRPKPAPLMVPIFGMGDTAYFLSEPLPPWKMEAAGLVIAGLVVNLFWPAIQLKIKR